MWVFDSRYKDEDDEAQCDMCGEAVETRVINIDKFIQEKYEIVKIAQTCPICGHLRIRTVYRPLIDE